MIIPKKPIHQALAILMLIAGGPVLIVPIGACWLALAIGDVLLSILSWPFRLVAGLAAVVLGGDR